MHRLAASAAAAALLQARLESSDLKRAVDCSVRSSRARLRRARLGSVTSRADSVAVLGENIVIQTAGSNGKEGQAAMHPRKEAA